MEKAKLIDLIVSDLVDTVTQMALTDPGSLEAFLREQLDFESVDKESLEAQAEGLGLLETGTW